MQLDKTAKKLTAGVVTIIILAFCLCLTTFALVWATVSVEDNLFRTGKVAINLNDGKPVIKEDEFLFEPGMTVVKDFFIENNSTHDVYYRLYFDNITGGLADVLRVQIKDGGKVLLEGTPNALVKQNVSAAEDVLKLKERKTLAIVFHFPKESGNDAQNLTLAFDFCAEAVQTKNNPDKSFH